MLKTTLANIGSLKHESIIISDESNETHDVVFTESFNDWREHSITGKINK